jgi:RNA-directed DNA polymerase
MKNKNNIEQSYVLDYGQMHLIPKHNILEQFRALKTKDEFLELLNVILIVELDKSSKKKFTKSQLDYFLARLAGNDNSSKKSLNPDIYSTFEIKKKSGASRIINAPNDDLVLLLHCIDVLVKIVSKPHHKAYGFVEGKSIVDGAKIHVGKNYVYNIDLKDFFHSFDLNRVKMGFYNQPFNLKGELEPIAYMIACLTTYKINGKRVLPQGSPSSPSITNLLCWRLDHRLSGLAKRFGVDYTRYADDITFSSNHNCYKDKFLTELKRIIKVEGLSINPKKTRLQSNLIRQEVTGLTVNQKLNVTGKYIKDVRMYLYYCEQYGLIKATTFYEKDYKEIKSELLSEKPPELELFLKGKLNYLSMVKGKDDPTYLKLESRFANLFGNKTSYVSSIIELWKSDGIDAARNKFYSDKKHKSENIQFNIIYKDLIELKDYSISDEKILIAKTKSIGRMQELWKNAFNRNYPFEFYKNTYSWQFDSDLEIDLAYKEEVISGNNILLESKLIEPVIKVFIKSLKGKEEKERGKDFLLNMIDKDFKELNKLIKNKEITTDFLHEKFIIFNSNLK